MTSPRTKSTCQKQLGIATERVYVPPTNVIVFESKTTCWFAVFSSKDPLGAL